MTDSNRLPVACIAHALDETTLAVYGAEVDDLEPGELKDTLLKLYRCIENWFRLPESKRTDIKQWEFTNGTTGEKMTCKDQPLEEEHVKALWDTTPWMRELVAIEPLLDSIDSITQKPLRDMAFHLLWFAKELTLDREPMTTDKLTKVA